MNPTKPGWTTSEFYVSLVASGIAILVLFGVLGPSDTDTANQVIGKTITDVFALITSLGAAWKFIQSRIEVKKADIEAKASVEVVKADAVSLNQLSNKLSQLGINTLTNNPRH